MHFEFNIQNLLEKIKANEATRSEDKKIFGFDINNLITCIVLTAVTLSALCDIISHMFGSIKKRDLSNASRRRMECLIFCLTLYVVCTLSMFWKRFEVSKYNLSFNLLSFSLVRSYLIYQFLISSY